MNKKIINAIINGIDEVTQAHNHNMRRDRPYDGQPWTDAGIRGSTEIKGITFRDLKDAFIRALIQSADYQHPANAAMQTEAAKGENATLTPGDVYHIEGDVDFIAVSQNLSCEIEKLMGIFPNINKSGIPSSKEIMSELFGEKNKPGDVVIPGLSKNLSTRAGGIAPGNKYMIKKK